MPYYYRGKPTKYCNVLDIKTDSLLIDEGYSITELKRILKRHYLNNGAVPYYAESPNKAFIQVTLNNSKNGKQLKELLIKITRSFDKVKEEVKDTIELRILFDYLTPMPPPPLPLFHSNKIEED
ncbi:hypothetical protein Celal_3581 [Cellulophaga algicola DSM 14237]|uniref:Uncharacterized protein n=1 Tax=Cellulophaga algicola (strain DSM 14237 / IC166 / ACAM 630) TaxID=688270 RepID=E6X932_CELAD|nr:hypothetical protein [Cellulophaga algicola]ADV50842.1 hypothetical protein Celal_3581 [Cellulophaga algicola DSM 14237]